MVNLEAYETQPFGWREEFERAYVEWVDLELVHQLLDSMNHCSIRFLCDAINDTTRWPSKINKTLKTVSYPRIRDAADFLGVPPWLLFNHPDKNTKIKELFTSIDSILKPIELPYFSEYEKDYANFHHELCKRVKSEEDYQILKGMLEGLFESKNYQEIISGNWKAVFSFFEDIHHEFSGGAKFFYRDPDGFIRGSLRVNFTFNPRNKRKLIKAGWLSIETDLNKSENSETVNRLLTTIMNDMEWLFDQQPWIFETIAENKHIRLLTWHTLRSSNEHFEIIAALINGKLPKANFAMNVESQRAIGLPSNSSLIKSSTVFDEFLQIIKTDVKHIKEPLFKRRTNTLQLLYEKRILQEGHRIVLIISDNISGPSLEKSICQATVVIRNGKPAVKWDYDEKLYSISRLTSIILIELAKQTHLRKHHLNGTKYWKLENESDSSLFDLAQMYQSR
ncbi:hypothetical protein ACN6KS_26960 [Paenibacillus nitricinens]|uniref:hypothetical protein n=1 Tax=Paenibacillus nitricinens TaxID=3367691 RepID=UPI003F858C4F